ncbi:unnamed protein product [Paramecium sonneborni]|uniref:Uncharacterized protein n=1 Tax=Paramecium sonneborni TaxID=65129 RepID=A0A8S1JV95_9CILI|nr:unnamed protein product [Paramecium sonneborni]
MQQSDQVEVEYRIEMLTSELERSSQALQQKSIECEEWRLKSLGLEQKIKDLQAHLGSQKQQFEDLTENLKQKAIEVEDLRSKYNRVQFITIKGYEEKMEQLVREIEQLNQLLMQKAQDCESSRQQVMTKIQELQEERQKCFHLDSFMKQIKSEKLEALHFLNEKNKELEELKERFREADQYRQKSEILENDIETIRVNYMNIFNQKLEEIDALQAQIDTQRLINENTIRIAEEKYAQQIQVERLNLQRQIKEQVATSIVQMENQVATLNNLLEAKQNEIDKLKLQRHNIETEKMNSMLIDKNIKLQDQQIKLQQLERQLYEKANTLDQLTQQIQNGQLIPATSQSLLERSYKQLQDDMHKQNIELTMLQQRCLELQEDVQKKANMKANYEGQINTLLIEIANLKRDVYNKSRINSQHSDNQRLIQFENEKRAIRQKYEQDMKMADDKIRYLLSIVDQRVLEQQLQHRGTLNPNPVLQQIMEESSSRIAQSNIYYHEDSDVLNDEIR